jgi:hypothetical protein
LKRALHNSAIYYISISAVDREKLFRRCNETVLDFEKYLSCWLMVLKVEHIKRDNVKDFIRWAFFNPEYTEEQQE